LYSLSVLKITIEKRTEKGHVFGFSVKIRRIMGADTSDLPNQDKYCMVYRVVEPTLVAHITTPQPIISGSRTVALDIKSLLKSTKRAVLEIRCHIKRKVLINVTT
jgi:hypothetical protein